jgi:hypothetical protein
MDRQGDPAVIFTTDPELIKNPDYNRVSATIFRLIQSGATQMGQGWCVSMSDTVYTLLRQQGINSRLVECQASVTGTTREGGVYSRVVGVDQAYTTPYEVSSHVVVVAETTPPLIIDASIGHLLPDAAVLIDRCGEPSPDRIFGDFQQENFHITYQEKLNPKVPLVHQASVINRIVTDQRIFSDISLLKRLNYIGIAMGLFALINVVGKMLGIL